MGGAAVTASRAKAALRVVTPRPVQRAVHDRRVDGALAREFFEGRTELDGYRAQLEQTPLLSSLSEARARFAETVSGTTSSGSPYSFGGFGPRAGSRLYALIRRLSPSVVVETGVCNGASSALILQALNDNGSGHLHSIDVPEYEGESRPSELWGGKGGAVVPDRREPGWVIPHALRDRWSLTLGRSQEELGPLLERVGAVDLFLHDSEHSYECMMFEFTTVYPHVKSGGVIATDDMGYNDAFGEFAAGVSRRVFRLDDGVALIRK